jgi:sterol desaturase/sphingolipid hydroxylase (fatty acid hydroxylase superfamily)
MEKIVEYINGLDFNILVVILMTIFFSLERLINSPHKFDKRIPHLLNNLALGIASILMNFAVAAVQITLLQWGDSKHLGLFYHVEVPFWLKIIIGLAVLDMSSYWMHRLSHRSPLLWRLHRVHHSDTTMDSSSYFRGHPFEAWTFGLVNILAALIIGADSTIVTFYFVFLLHGWTKPLAGFSPHLICTKCTITGNSIIPTLILPTYSSSGTNYSAPINMFRLKISVMAWKNSMNLKSRRSGIC